MSYVNGTTHYNLPQTVGTDKRDWADTNQAFADVDAALYTASETASTAASNISTLDNQINGEGGIDARLTTAENDIDNVEGSVSTLQNTVSGHTTAIAAVRTDCEDMIVAVEITAAQMEDSPVAIPTGSYFRYNDVLYVATDNIAIHDVIVPNTNCEATNVATELGEIKSDLSSISAITTLPATEDSGTSYSGQKTICSGTVSEGKYLVYGFIEVENTSGGDLLADITSNISGTQYVKYSILNNTAPVLEFVGLANATTDGYTININVGCTGTMKVTRINGFAVKIS